MKQKVLFLLLGFILAVIFLEIFLQLGAWVVLRAREKDKSGSKKQAYRVLCLGDSFTYGLGAPKGRSYPDQLQVLLDSRAGKNKFQVINAGHPGMNTALLEKEIKHKINNYKPDLVLASMITGILMVLIKVIFLF